MHYLETVRPKDAIGIVALSWIDYYPSEEENHILGLGSVQSGCAAISFGHYGLSTAQSQATASKPVQHYTSNTSLNQEATHTGIHAVRLRSKVDLTDSYEEKRRSFGKGKLQLRTEFLDNLKNYDFASSKRAISCIDISRKPSFTGSDRGSLSGFRGLSTSSSSFKHFGSKSSIDNPWAKVFAEHESVSSSESSLTDFRKAESFEVIDAAELGNSCELHVVEENTIEMAIPKGCSFQMSCVVVWRLIKV